MSMMERFERTVARGRGTHSGRSGGRLGYLDCQGNLVKDQARWDQYAGSDDFQPRCRQRVFLPVCMGGYRRARVTAGNTGSKRGLVPTNATSFLKNIATRTVGEFLCAACRSHPC